MGTACYVRFEVPKFAGGDNYHPVNRKGTVGALKQVETQLAAVGIKTNVSTAQISRLDAFRNVVADEPFPCYQPVLALLKGVRMKQRGYENGFLWENTRQQVCFYDKLQKMAHDKLSVAGLPGNSLRCEMRLLESRKVRDVLSMASVKDLIENYQNVRVAYEATMKKQLFRYDASDVETIVTSELREQMMYFRENYGRNWHDYFWKMCGLHAVLQRCSIEAVMSAVEDVAENRMKRSRLKSSLTRMRFESESVRCLGKSKRTTGQLYAELREKVLLAA